MASLSEPGRSRWGTAVTDVFDLAGMVLAVPLAVLLVGTPFALAIELLLWLARLARHAF